MRKRHTLYTQTRHTYVIGTPRNKKSLNELRKQNAVLHTDGEQQAKWYFLRYINVSLVKDSLRSHIPARLGTIGGGLLARVSPTREAKTMKKLTKTRTVLPSYRRVLSEVPGTIWWHASTVNGLYLILRKVRITGMRTLVLLCWSTAVVSRSFWYCYEAPFPIDHRDFFFLLTALVKVILLV